MPKSTVRTYSGKINLSGSGTAGFEGLTIAEDTSGQITDTLVILTNRNDKSTVKDTIDGTLTTSFPAFPEVGTASYKWDFTTPSVTYTKNSFTASTKFNPGTENDVNDNHGGYSGRLTLNGAGALQNGDLSEKVSIKYSISGTIAGVGESTLQGTLSGSDLLKAATAAERPTRAAFDAIGSEEPVDSAPSLDLGSPSLEALEPHFDTQSFVMAPPLDLGWPSFGGLETQFGFQSLLLSSPAVDLVSAQSEYGLW